MNKIKDIVLTKEQMAELQKLSRSSSSDYRYVVRAKIILMFSDGKSYNQIMQAISLGKKPIAKWKRRYAEFGIEGLKDAPRSGKPSTYSEADRSRVIQLACEKPQDGYTNTSQRRIAKKTGMSQATVQKILKSHDLKPHKTEYWCGKSRDPEFEEKMLNVVGLYLNPPENAIVLSVDEKTQMQALDRTQPVLPMVSGYPERQTATYKRNGTVSLIAALEVHSGEITGNIIDKNNSKNFLKFLKKLDRKYRHTHLHIIVDNLSVHKNSEIKEWLSHKRKVTMHFTPTYSSWLNQIEIWFNILTKDVLKGAVWTSKKEMVRQIIKYIKTYNDERSNPFEWTYDGTKSE